MLVVAGRPGGELRHVESAERDRAGLPEAGEGGAVVVRHEVPENPGAAGGDLPGAVEHVLVRDRHPVQWPGRFSAGQGGVRRRGGFERPLGLERDEAVQHRLQPLGPGNGGFHRLDCGKLPRGDRIREVNQA